MPRTLSQYYATLTDATSKGIDIHQTHSVEDAIEDTEEKINLIRSNSKLLLLNQTKQPDYGNCGVYATSLQHRPPPGSRISDKANCKT